MLRRLACTALHDLQAISSLHAASCGDAATWWWGDRPAQHQSQEQASCSGRCSSEARRGFATRGRAAEARPDRLAPGPGVPVHRVRREVAFDDEGQAAHRLKFVSRERRLVPRPPFYRPPIYFPDAPLQMLPLTEQQKALILRTGWAREVAFKTLPSVTKLEIKGMLESMYGMEVERVHTMNYLGRKYVTFTAGKRPKKLLWRADDWKKAYVIFKRPETLELAEADEYDVYEEPPPSMVQQLLAARGLVQLKERRKLGAEEQVSLADVSGGADGAGTEVEQQPQLEPGGKSGGS